MRAITKTKVVKTIAIPQIIIPAIAIPFCSFFLRMEIIPKIRPGIPVNRPQQNSDTRPSTKDAMPKPFAVFSSGVSMYCGYCGC